MKNEILAVAGVAALFISGCSVLTVDVDVYTGPLSHTREVQVDQVISLVMASKPLLVQLRDQLETDSDSELHDLRRKKWYRAGYVDLKYGAELESAGKTQLFFKNDQAIRVNETLGLYDDLVPAVYPDFLNDIGASVNEYAKAYRRFALDKGEDRVFFAKSLEKIRAESSKQCISNLLAKFIAPPDGVWRSATNLYDSTEICQLGLVNQNDYSFTEASSWILKKQLRELSIVKNSLDTDDAAPLTNIVARAEEISRTFIESRKALREALATSLLMIVYASEDKRLNDSSRHAIVDSAILFTAKLIHPDVVRFGTDSDQVKSVDAMAEALGISRPIGRQSNETIAEIVVRQLSSDTTARAAGALEVLKGNYSGDPHEFFVVRGPTEGVGALGYEQLKAALDSLTQNLQSTLSGGRRQLGLETLITKYLYASTNHQRYEERIKSAEFQILAEELVNFGEKVVTLGNTATLLPASVGKLGNVSDTKTGKRVAPASPKNETKDFMAVLQYVGNTIIVHLDEIRHWSRYDDQQRSISARTVAALDEHAALNWDSSVTNFTAKEALSQLRFQLQAEYINYVKRGCVCQLHEKSQSPDLAQASIDVAAPPLSPNGQPVAHRDKPVPVCQCGLVDAIRQVTVMHNDMIYLRPASAYLKSSFPASTLNSNSGGGSRNELAAQAWRSIPIIGSVTTLGSQDKRKRLQELDQQSWQRINQVRVSGAGRANYVLAKDDIGNWYVKQYTNDTSRIMKSAKNLAMFAAGDAFGTTGLSAANSGGATSSNNVPQFFAAQLTQLNGDLMSATDKLFTSLAGKLSDEQFLLPLNDETDDGEAKKRIRETYTNLISTVIATARTNSSLSDKTDSVISLLDGALIFRERVKSDDIISSQLKTKYLEQLKNLIETGIGRLREIVSSQEQGLDLIQSGVSFESVGSE